jgi:hypothetical protein
MALWDLIFEMLCMREVLMRLFAFPPRGLWVVGILFTRFFVLGEFSLLLL